MNTNLSKDNFSHQTNSITDVTEKIGQNVNVSKMQRDMLSEHIQSLATKNRTWVDKLSLSKEEKALLKQHSALQREAANAIMSSEVKAITAVCDAQLSFTRETLNAMIKTGVAGLKAGSDVIFLDIMTQRAARIEQTTKDFYNLIERKIEDMSGRHEMIQRLGMRDIDQQLKSWESTTTRLLDEFNAVLSAQV